MDLSSLIGRRVRWEASGRGRRTILEGEVVQAIEPGTTNADALETLKAAHPDLLVRSKYCRFDKKTYQTKRVFVLVKQDTNRLREVYWIYAPNVAELMLV